MMTRPAPFALALVLLLASAFSVMAQSANDPAGFGRLAQQADDQVNVTADNLEITEDDNTALFTGNVTITQGTMQMLAQRVDVLYGEGGPSDLVEFTATGGRVHMAMDGQTIDGDNAVYNFAQRILTFTGNVVVKNASGTVNADRLVIDTRAGTSSFSGGPAQGGRVTSTFTPANQ